MKSVFKTSLSLCLIALFFSAVASAQTVNQNIPASTPTSRFTDNGDGTITDKATGLMWKKCSEGQTGADCAGGVADTYMWQGALQQAQAVSSGVGFAGHTDWRVPNIKELDSIVEERCSAPAINLSVFPNTVGNYWSSSSCAFDGSYAWVVYSYDGGDSWSYKYGNYYVRLVRGGQ